MREESAITWGIGTWQSHVVRELVDFAGLCERRGFDQLWYGNEKLHPDMWIGLTALAFHTRRLRLGTFIADPYSVHPALTAAMIATLDHYSGGRAVLILGAGGSGLRELGLARSRPVAALEEAVAVVRGLLRGEEVRREGEVWSVDGQLHFPPRPDVPIWIASRGARVLELAGAVADGVMIGTFARPAEIEAAVRRVRAGAASVGRDPSEPVLAVRVDVSLSEDERAAQEAVRGFIAGVLSASYPDRGFVGQAGLEVPAELEDICRTKDLALAWRSGSLVTDEFVEAFAWAGAPDGVARKIAAAVDLGIRNITVMFHPPAGGSLAEQVEVFAAEVVPRVHALVGAGAIGGQS